MAVTLSGLALPDLAIENEFGRIEVDAQAEQALDTTIHIWSQALKPIPLDLVGGENTATMTRAELTPLKALADVPGATYTLVHNSISRTVMFRVWDAPAIEATPLGPREVLLTTDIYNNIRIKLMEV